MAENNGTLMLTEQLMTWSFILLNHSPWSQWKVESSDGHDNQWVTLRLVSISWPLDLDKIFIHPRSMTVLFCPSKIKTPLSDMWEELMICSSVSRNEKCQVVDMVYHHICRHKWKLKILTPLDQPSFSSLPALLSQQCTFTLFWFNKLLPSMYSLCPFLNYFSIHTKSFSP